MMMSGNRGALAVASSTLSSLTLILLVCLQHVLFLVLCLAVPPLSAQPAEDGAALPSPPAGAAIQLTAEERAWIKNHPRVRLGVDPEFQPFTFLDNEGQLRGISSEFIDILNHRLGLRMTAVPGLSWQEATAGSRKGSIDVLPCVGMTNERKAFLFFSHPYLDFTRVLITRTDMPFLTGLVEVTPMRVGTRRFSSHEDYLQKHASVSPTLYDTLQEGLQAVSKGTVDVYVATLAPATHWIRQMQLTNLKVAASLSNDSPTLHFAVRRDWPELVSILNKGLASIDKNQTLAIINRWTVNGIAPDPGRTKLPPTILGLVSGILLILALLLTWRRLLGQEIGKRKEMEHSLQRSQDFEQLVTRTTTRFIDLKATEIDTAINASLKDIAAFAQAEAAYVFLLNEDGTGLIMSHDYHSHTVREDVQAATRLNTQEMQWWLQQLNRKPFLEVNRVMDLPSEACWTKRFTYSRGVTSLLDTGLNWQGTLVGFIGLASVKAERVWDTHSSSLLALTAHLFTNVLENQKLEQRLTLSSCEDPLTGTANRRYFVEVYSREWFRALRDQILLSIICIEVDGFYQFTRTYGHQSGDDCLRTIAADISSCLQRSSDLVARFGADNFTVLLVNTDSRGAVQIAAAMRDKILAEHIPHEHGPHLHRVTISAGVATMLPEKGMPPDLLLETGSTALQEARENGGNQIIHTLR